MRQVKSKVAFFLIFQSVFAIILEENEIPFQTFNQTMAHPSSIVYSRANQTLRAQIQFSGQLPLYQNYIGYLTTQDSFLAISQQGESGYFLYDSPILDYIFTSRKDGFYIMMPFISSSSSIFGIKFTWYINNFKVKQHYQTGYKVFSTGLNKLILQFKTTKQCDIKINWSGRGFPMKIFEPNINIVSGTPLLSLPENVFTFRFHVGKAGVWTIVVENNLWAYSTVQRGIMKLSTFQGSRCENPCSNYGYPVVGLAPKTNQTCICDYTIENLLWNSKSSRCQLCIEAKCQAFSPNICGDNITIFPQQCDNGNVTGCINCSVSNGYVCTGFFGSFSKCRSKCGDNIKMQDQQCDNINSTGCVNCKIAKGYKCTSSVCFSICGDNILASDQQCDNGNNSGCLNCKIQKGYKCLTQQSSSICTNLCGDSFKTQEQQCDNGNSQGCIQNCKLDLGFYCTLNKNGSSVCSNRCGDGVRSSNQQCDNGNKTGCIDCKMDKGYFCPKRDLGVSSSCTSICGDSIRTMNQECDNGDKAGCTKNCKQDQGYKCTGEVSFSSRCDKLFEQIIGSKVGYLIFIIAVSDILNRMF